MSNPWNDDDETTGIWILSPGGRPKPVEPKTTPARSNRDLPPPFDAEEDDPTTETERKLNWMLEALGHDLEEGLTIEEVQPTLGKPPKPKRKVPPRPVLDDDEPNLSWDYEEERTIAFMLDPTAKKKKGN